MTTVARTRSAAIVPLDLSGLLTLLALAQLTLMIGEVRGVAPALLTLLIFTVTPGYAVANRVLRLRGVESAAVSVALSVTVTILLSGAQVMAGWFRPELCTGVLGGASVLLLVARAPADDGPRRISRSRLAPSTVGVISLLSLAVAAWALSVAQLDMSALGPGGLLPILPVSYFVAIGLVVIAFILGSGTLEAGTRGWLLGATVMTTVLVLHGVFVAANDAPRYAWVYKHVGVTDYFANHGGASLTVDIYHNYPGFLAGGAAYLDAAGLSDPVVLARWAPLIFMVGFVLAIRYLVGAFVTSPLQQWLPPLLFVIFYWDYQAYYAPQAPAFVLAIVVIGLLLRRCKPAALGLVEAAPREPSRGSWDLVLALAACTAIVISHQITPVLLIAATVVLVVFAGLRPRWLPFAFAAIFGAFTALRYPYIRDRFALFSRVDPSNFVTPGVRSDPPWSITANIYIRGAMGVVIVLLAGAGIIWCWRNHVRVRIPILCVVALSSVGFVQPYGGEAILRSYLFSLPFLALLATRWLTGPLSRGNWSRVGRVGTSALLLGTSLAWLVAYYGLDYINTFTADEVKASQYFYEETPEFSEVIALGGPAGAATFPWRAADGYALRSDGRFLPRALLIGRPLGTAEYVEELRENLVSRGTGTYYVLLSQSMIRAQEMRDDRWFGVSEFAAVRTRLQSDPMFTLVFDRPTAWIFRYNGAVR